MGRSSRHIPEHLPRKLYLIRLFLKLTQEQLAERLQSKETPLYPGHISGFERGVREPPMVVLLKYARLSGVSMETLVDDEMDLPPDPFRAISNYDRIFNNWFKPPKRKKPKSKKGK
jgi:transcriptional regulator with XRE-family HTH domain